MYPFFNTAVPKLVVNNPPEELEMGLSPLRGVAQKWVPYGTTAIGDAGTISYFWGAPL